MANVTLEDIARAAGVSVTTASFVMNNKGHISPGVREKVIATAKNLGYSKLVSAKEKPTAPYKPLAVLVHEDYEKAFEWKFIRQMIISLEAVISEKGFSPVIVPVKTGTPAREVLEKSASSTDFGLFSIHFANAELFEILQDSGIPVVVINNSEYQDRFTTVCTDDYQGVYEGVRYILSMNHRDTLYIEYERPDFSVLLKDSYFGYAKALSEFGIPQEPNRRLTVPLYRRENLFRKLQKIFTGPKETFPTACFCLDDYLAARVLSELSRIGVETPRDISVAAMGDMLDYNEPFIPKITTMAVDVELMGKMAGELMLRRLDKEEERENKDAGKSHPEVIKIKPRLIERGTVLTPVLRNDGKSILQEEKS